MSSSCKAKITFLEYSLLRTSILWTFVLLYRRFALSNFVIANIQRSSLIFRGEPNKISLESSMIFRSKFAGPKGEFRRISFAFLLHNTVRANAWSPCWKVVPASHRKTCMKALQRNTGHTCTRRDTQRQNNGICRESPINGRVKIHREIENIIILLLLFIEPKKCVSMFQADCFTDSGPPFNGFYQIYFRSRNVLLLVVTLEVWYSEDYKSLITSTEPYTCRQQYS